MAEEFNQTIPTNTTEVTPNATVPSENLTDAPKSGATSFYKEQTEKLKRELEAARIEKLEAQKRLGEIEEAKLREQNQWKELAEKFKKEKESVAGEFDTFKDYFVKEKKYSAIQQEAIKAGIREEALNDLSLLDSSDTVQIETTSTGKVNVLGTKEFVENLKTIRPHWFKNATPPRINTASPEYSAEKKELSVSDILKLQKTNPVEYNRIMRERISSKK